MNNYAKAAEPAGKIRSSITNKLNTKLFFRRLGSFLSLNVVICIIAGIALAFYCESRVISALEMVSEQEPPAVGEWMELSGMIVRKIPERSVGGATPWPLKRLLPYETESASRGFRASSDGFTSTLRSIAYVVNFDIDGEIIEIELRIGPFILYFFYAFSALFVFQLFALLSQTIKDRRMIRRTLGPIAELARAAQSLSETNKQLDHEEMVALAGRLDGIDARRLDTRIQVDDLQDELRNVAIAINDMLDRINESYAAQARFVSDASHELRTPIAVIQGYANLLDRWGKDDEKTLSESVTAIKDEAENMKDLVEQLLFLARGDSNRIRLTEERIELSALIEEVVSETLMLDSGRQLRIAAGNATVLADKALIKQALRILVDNAIKYTDHGGEIEVSASSDGDSARLSVTDNGIGISPEILPRVFDRFVRADESRARATGGAGLGLSIAQWIATRHKGYLELLSREGIGTRITLVLPALIEAQKALPTKKEDTPSDLIETEYI